MKAIVASEAGGAEVLAVQEVADAVAGAGEVLVRVRAAGVNRADLLQRQGNYAPPAGASAIIGLEVAGDLLVDAGIYKAGQPVMALVSGGGYAELAAVPIGQLIPIPAGLSYAQAAAIPEAFLTAYRNLFDLGGLQAGMSVLVHAGGSGVGSAAVQLAREAGATVFATASSGKLDRLRELGASVAIDYRAEQFDAAVLAATDEHGVDIILDFIGAAYWEMNLNALARGGRLLLIGQLGGRKVEANLGVLLTKALHVIGSTLRRLSVAEKADLTQRFSTFALPRFAAGRLVPLLDRTYPYTQAAAAHRYMESNANFGKIVLEFDSPLLISRVERAASLLQRDTKGKVSRQTVEV